MYKLNMRDKNNRRMLLSVLIVFAMFTSLLVPMETTCKTLRERIDVPESVSAYAREHYEEVLDSFKSIEAVENISKDSQNIFEQKEQMSLGRPFVIYEIDKEEQDEIYYYPLVNKFGEIVLLLQVSGTTEGWNLSVSREWVKELNQMGNLSSECIFYKAGDSLYSETPNAKYR